MSNLCYLRKPGLSNSPDYFTHHSWGKFLLEVPVYYLLHKKIHSQFRFENLKKLAEGKETIICVLFCTEAHNKHRVYKNQVQPHTFIGYSKIFTRNVSNFKKDFTFNL